MNGYAYIIVIFGILLAKGFGFVRNIIFATAFGATELTDIYFQIFSIPTFIFTGIGTALATIAIKNLNKSENKELDSQKKYVSKFICKSSIGIIIAMIIMYISTGIIVKLILPGIEPLFYEEACKMMYIMIPSALFIVVAYIMSAVLQNCKVFFVTSIMSLPYNIIIIAALLFRNIDIFTVCWITTLGWFLHIIILLPSFYHKGFRFFYRSKNSVTIFSGKRNLDVIYIFISSMMFQMCFMFDKAAVSHEVGAVTTINYASNFFIMIASIFVCAMSNVSFPSICKNYELNKKEEVKRTIVQLLSTLIAIIFPFILVTVIFGRNIMTLLYESEKFTKELTNETAILFIIYTFSIFGYVCQELFNKVLYLGARYKVSFIGSLVIMILKPIINLFAVNYGVVAVATSTTVLTIIYAITIFYEVVKVTGNYITKDLLSNISKIICGSIVFLVTYFFISSLQIQVLPSEISFLLPLSICMIVYILFAYVSGLLKSLLGKSKEV